MTFSLPFDQIHEFDCCQAQIVEISLNKRIILNFKLDMVDRDMQSYANCLE